MKFYASTVLGEFRQAGQSGIDKKGVLPKPLMLRYSKRGALNITRLALIETPAKLLKLSLDNHD